MEVRILPEPESPRPFDPTEWSREDLDPDPGRSSRRAWFATLGVGAIAAAGGWVARDRMGAGDSAELAWLRLMAEMPEADLVAFAGLFERKAMTTSERSEELTAAFGRLLDISMASSLPGSDRAGCAALRALQQLGARDRLARARPPADKPLTRELLARMLGHDAGR